MTFRRTILIVSKTRRKRGRAKHAAVFLVECQSRPYAQVLSASRASADSGASAGHPKIVPKAM